jgi:Flp pilus assembly protein TadG
VRFLPSASGRRRQGGSTTVEFSMVFPLLALILFGAIDGGRLVIDRFMVSYAAVLGARLASVRKSAGVASPVTAIQTAVVAAVPFLQLSNGAVAVAVNGTSATDASFPSHPTGSPNTVTVTVTYNYQAVFIPFYNHAVKTLTGSSQVVIE